MSQQANGPSTEYDTTIKNEINKDMQQIPHNSNPTQPSTTPAFAEVPNAHPRPLNRVDSRSNFQYRPPFPNQGVRPNQPRPILPPGAQQFVQRSPVPGAGVRPQVSQNQGQPVQGQAPRLNYRPQTPFPRAGVPNQRPQGIFQQRSVPSFGTPRPPLTEENLNRSQTLDITENDYIKTQDEGKIINNDYVKIPSIAAMNNRSYSLSSNAPEMADSNEEARRRSVSSVDSIGEGRFGSRQGSMSGSTEGLDKKDDDSSRPESRAMSRMNKIMEDEDKSPNHREKSSNNFVDNSCKTTENSSKSQEVKSSKVALSEGASKTTEPKGREQEVKPSTDSSNESSSRTTPKSPGGRNEDTGKAKDSKKCLDLGKSPKAKSPARSEGDNDSGVDESTQGNDQSSNGENRSPRKSSKTRTATSTPLARSLSRGSKSPSLKSPDSNATTPGSTSEKKKVPMNKIQVGSAPSPNLKVVKSKIGSLENTSYKPGGGKIKIETKKLDFKTVTPRIEAKNDKYISKGGEKKIVQQKLQWSAKSKIGSLENATHKPKGGDKKIESIKLDFKVKAKSKVGSKDNIKYQPGGGDIKPQVNIVEDKDIDNEKYITEAKEMKEIETKKLDLKVTSKVGSLDNVKYKPGGGDKKIFDDKDYLKQKSAVSSMDHSLSGSQNSLPSQQDSKVPEADENLNQEH